jgi:PKD repeat protein
MYESMSRDLAPLTLSIVAIVIFIVLAGWMEPGSSGEDLEAPVANAGSDRTVSLGQTVAFDGSGSSDDVDIVSWEWSLRYAGSDLSFGGEYALFTFDRAGMYQVTLTVRDAAGNSDTDTFWVSVV